jgi:hypothetical protein
VHAHVQQDVPETGGGLALTLTTASVSRWVASGHSDQYAFKRAPRVRLRLSIPGRDTL